MSELRGAFTIRPVAPGDVEGVLALVHELARCEREPDAVEMTAEQLHEALFAAGAQLFGHVATDTSGAGAVIGMALWFCNFSTWRGRHGVYLEDLYVHPEHRRRGIGEALLATLAKECVDRAYARLEWSVLNWNEPAIASGNHADRRTTLARADHSCIEARGGPSYRKANCTGTFNFMRPLAISLGGRG